jgi:hypothetical protein
MHACGSGGASSCKQVATTDGVYYNICNIRSTFATNRWNICNIRLKQIKHLRHTWTPLQHVQHPDLLLKHTDVILATYKRRQMKYLKHAYEKLAKNTWKVIVSIRNIQIKILAIYVCNICNIQINTLIIYVWKIRWNIEDRRLQHMCTTIATYATSWFIFATCIWNTCNIPFKYYFCKCFRRMFHLSSFECSKCCIWMFQK